MTVIIWSRPLFTFLVFMSLAGWLSGSTLVSINEVTLRQTWLILRWVTVCWRVNYLRLWPATQANLGFYPQLVRKWVPTKVRWCSAAGSKGCYGSLRFKWGIAEAKYILATAICVSVCLSVCLSLAALAHYCMDPDETWGMVGGVL